MTHPVDQALLAGFLVLTLVIGWRKARAGEGADASENASTSYLLAGRRLTLAPFIATMVSTWYGGILGVGEYTFTYGISNWLVFGVPYYVAAALFALLIASRARESNAMTLPEQLRESYGDGPARMGAVLVFVTTLPAAYVLTLGVLLELAFGIPLMVGLVVSAAFSVAYLWRAGFAAVTRTDILQFALMFGGFATLTAVLLVGHGLAPLSTLPETHWTWHGGMEPQAIAVWYIIAMSTLVEPTFYQRCFAAESPAVARRGVLISIGCWMIFDAMSTTCGLYGRALLHDLSRAQAAEVYPRLAELVLPTGLVGVFFISLFAVVMSTVDSYLFLAGSTVGRDVLERRERWRDRPQAATRVGLVVAAVGTVALASTSKSVVKIWHALGTVGTCTLLIPLLGAFIPKLRMSSRGALALMLVALPLSTTWLLIGRLSEGGRAYPFELEPIYPGLGVGGVIWVLDRMLNSRSKT